MEQTVFFTRVRDFYVDGNGYLCIELYRICIAGMAGRCKGQRDKGYGIITAGNVVCH